MPPSNIVLWSVGVEIWFSVLFPIIVIAVYRWGLWRVFFGIFLICFFFNVLGLAISIDRVGHFVPFTNGVLGKAYEFLFGMVACHYFVNPSKLWPLESRWYWISALSSFLVCVASVAARDAAPNNWIGASLVPIFVCFFSIFMLSILLGARGLRRLFEIKFIQLLGCMCYSIYAWHGIILNVMVPPSSEIGTTITFLPLFLVVTFSLSALSYRYIEFGAREDWRALFLLGKTADRRIPLGEQNGIDRRVV